MARFAHGNAYRANPLLLLVCLQQSTLPNCYAPATYHTAINALQASWSPTYRMNTKTTTLEWGVRRSVATHGPYY